METTIGVSESVKKHLDRLKIMERESYNDIIEVLLEDHMELSEKTKKELEERKNSNNLISHEEVKKRYGL